MSYGKHAKTADTHLQKQAALLRHAQDQVRNGDGGAGADTDTATATATAQSAAVVGHPWANRVTGLEYHRASSLTPHAANWRSHGPGQQTAMRGLLADIGIAGALLCYRTRDGVLTVLDGHMRQDLDPSATWPCVMLDVSDDEAAYVLATHDPIGTLATARQGHLTALLGQVRSQDAHVQALLASLGPTPAVTTHGSKCCQSVLDDAMTRYACSVGQVWQAGRHRVVCGDSTLPTTYAQLGPGPWDLCLTDPPYGVGEAYAGCPDTPQQVRERADAFLPLVSTYCTTTLLTTGTSHMYAYPVPSWVLAWVCPAGAGVGPWGFCCWHPVLAYGPDPYKPGLHGSRPDTLVLNAMAPSDTGHPCPKPLDVWAWLMQRGSPGAGETVLDPFLGSGTSLLVAEQLGRTCYGIELTPAYVAIALARWASMTGKTPELVTT